jgi:hypothetical protein
LRDALVGPQYLIFTEVLGPDEPEAELLLRLQTELWNLHNAAPSQPYYSRHPEIHLARGEVAAFLSAYYHQVAALADRETYFFWEHYYQSSPHKTHEEGWFLMQTRWMLWREAGDTLYLLPGMPRAWLRAGGRVVLPGVASSFGPLHLEVESQLERGRMRATLQLEGSRPPRQVRLRLPHPQGLLAAEVSQGLYEPQSESILLEDFSGQAEMEIRF